MDFTFVHAADLHLDSPFRALLGKSPVSARDATFRAFSRIVELCLEEKAAFLLLAGDLFDTKDRSVRARLFLRQQLERLDQAGIRTFIVHGNHDPLSGDTGALRLPKSVKVFGREWEEVPVERDGQLLCRVQGISYPQEAVRDNLAGRFRRQGPEFTIGLLHTNLGAQAAHANYAPCSPEDLEAAGLDYWALGHVHTRSEERLPGGGWVVYPGNPQGRHIQEAGERGCERVRVQGGRAELKFVALDVLRWHRLEVDLTGAVTLDEVQARAEQACAELSQGVDAHAVRLVLKGRGPMHAELARYGATELEDALRERLAARRPAVVLEAVDDESGPELDWDALRKGGLTGAVFDAAAHPAALAALWGDPELRRLDQLLHGAGLPSPREDGGALVDQAARRLVEALVETGGERP